MTQNPPEAPTENPSGAPGPDQGPRVTRDEVRDLGRLRRSLHDRHVAGVAGGLARHLDIDPIILRVAFVVLSFFGGAGLIAYAACWLLVPEEGSDEATLRLDDRSRGVALILVGVVAALALVGDSLGGWGFPWPLAVVALVVIAVLSTRGGRRGTVPEGAGGPYGPPSPAATSPATGPDSAAAYRPVAPPHPRKPGPILFWFTLAFVALALGVLGIVDAAPAADIPDSAYPALALAVTGVMLVVGAFYGRAGGLILVGLVAAVATAVTTVAGETGAGRIDQTPVSAASVQDEYDLFAGDIQLDLSEVRDPENLDGRTIDLDAVFGRILVTVPDDVDVRVDADVAGGETRLFGERQSRSNTSDHDSGDPQSPRLTINADLMFGEIVVDTDRRTLR